MTLQSTMPSVALPLKATLFIRMLEKLQAGSMKLSLPGGDVSLAHLRTPYPEGHYRINASHLYVSRGIGTTFTPVRLNAPPEVTLFKLI